MEPPRKRIRKISITLPCRKEFVWESPYNMEGEIVMSTTEIGDGASSRVYLGTTKDKQVAIKKLKGFSNNQSASFVKSY